MHFHFISHFNLTLNGFFAKSLNLSLPLHASLWLSSWRLLAPVCLASFLTFSSLFPITTIRTITQALMITLTRHVMLHLCSYDWWKHHVQDTCCNSRSQPCLIWKDDNKSPDQTQLRSQNVSKGTLWGWWLDHVCALFNDIYSISCLFEASFSILIVWVTVTQKATHSLVVFLISQTELCFKCCIDPRPLFIVLPFIDLLYFYHKWCIWSVWTRERSLTLWNKRTIT